MIAIGLVLAGLVLFVLVRFLVNWLESRPEPQIVVPPEKKWRNQGRIR